jgi:hypothetical protein
MKKLIAAAMLLTLLTTGNAFAGFVFTLKQVGSQVEITRTGSFNTNGFTPAGNTTFSGLFLNNNVVMAGSRLAILPIDRYSWSSVTRSTNAAPPVIPTSIFSLPASNTNLSSPSGGNKVAGFSFNTNTLFFANAIKSGSIYGTAGSVSNTTTAGGGVTLASMGFTVGKTDVYTFTSGGGTVETITITAVPEPSSLACVGGLVAGLSVLSRRRRQG